MNSHFVPTHRFFSVDAGFSIELAVEMNDRDEAGYRFVAGYDVLGNSFGFIECEPWQNVYESCWFHKYGGVKFDLERMEP